MGAMTLGSRSLLFLHSEAEIGILKALFRACLLYKRKIEKEIDGYEEGILFVYANQ